MAFYIREQVFEGIRNKYYPLLPSRQKCLWVCEEDQLAYDDFITRLLNQTCEIGDLTYLWGFTEIIGPYVRYHQAGFIWLHG